MWNIEQGVSGHLLQAVFLTWKRGFMPSDHKITVNSPCTGTQVVAYINGSLYAGSSGTFTYAVLSLPENESQWEFTIYNYGGVSGCSQKVSYFQNAPGNSADPSGSYIQVGGTGTADVATFP